MSNVGELGPIGAHEGIPATEGRNLIRPVVMIAFTLVCTLAWNVALLWGLFRICRIVFS